MKRIVYGIVKALLSCRRAKNDRQCRETSEESTVVFMREENTKVVTGKGSTLKYSCPIHGSVGYDYRVECDEDAFDVSYNVKYDRPVDVEAGMCGGDSAVKTVSFLCTKKGKFKIAVLKYFRGRIESRVDFVVVVC